MPTLCKDRDCKRADAAARARYQHFSARHAVVHERHRSKHGGVSGGSDRHRVACRQRRRNAHQVLTLVAAALSEATPQRFAGAPAIQYDVIAYTHV